MSAKQRGKNVPLTGDTIAGLFRDQASAERAIRALQRAGFAEDQIGVLMRDRERQQELTEHTGTKAEEGAAAGAMGGGLLGGTLGLLAGVGALVIPGIGPIIAGGAIVSTLAGAGIGAAAGGLLGALVGMGIPEEEARHFERGVQSGGILVTVRAAGRAAEARDILLAEGAELGRETAAGARTGATAANVSAADAEQLELREEMLRADKERVEAGEVRIREESRPLDQSWRDRERRYRRDPQYAGPERRVSV